MRPITDVAADLGLTPDQLVPYGHHMAKLPLDLLQRPARGRLVLVSAITPTPAGEGKTTTSIGLVQGMRKLGASACAALREPSLGPVFGMKGGGTGGGKSRVEPSTAINLHFTGDIHAITAAHNLLSALVDNHLHWDAAPALDPRNVLWPRAVDMNDRSLRNIVVGLSGEGVPREAGFVITAASEVMAILCLATDEADLRARLGRILVGFDRDGKPVTADDLGATGSMMALLHDAIRPNLVQTTDGTPAILHGGPFANIAHGCNSVIATRTALTLADWVVTEAGFAFDLGGEKFFDIKARLAGLEVAGVVLVATVRALKYHGGTELDALANEDVGAIERGLANLDQHIASVRAFGQTPVVAINRFTTDTDAEIAAIVAHCAAIDVACAPSDHFTRGGDGALELARVVMERLTSPRPAAPLYALAQPVPDKIRAIARTVYGARDVVFTKEALRDLTLAKKLGATGLPVCMAKTQSSLSDDPKRRGRPADFDVTVRAVQLSAGAGFLVVLTGEILRMPGLPRRPASADIDVVDGEIVGV